MDEEVEHLDDGVDFEVWVLGYGVEELEIDS